MTTPAADRASDKNRDEALVRQAAAGDASAFERLVRRYQRRVAALGRGFFRNAADAEDFVQDVFVKLHRKLASFRGESRFSTWLTRIAYNTAINAVNRRKEYATLADEDALCDGGRGPEEQQIRRITAEAVRESVRELPPRYALCVDLYFFHDLPYKEISAATALPVNTIKSHIFRAKKLLRDKLAAYYGED
jgi:RNA polymerase sigma-70 factor (ECF subfamily)